MSDLAATNCGCGCDDNCGGASPANIFGNGGSTCSCVLWVIILLALLGGSGVSTASYSNGGCGDNSCLLLVILLLCCGNGCGFGF